MTETSAVTRLQQIFLLVAVTLFAVAPLIVRSGIRDLRLPSPQQAMFYTLATLPGLIGLVNYVSSQRQRYELQKDALTQLEGVASRTDNANVTDATKFEPSFVAWLTGSLLLTGVFLVVAVLSHSIDEGKKEIPGIIGIVYAGYGAYVATLWYMVGRLNAHALSPRFLINSAIKAAIAILLGFIASTSIGFFMPAAAATAGAAAGGAAAATTSTTTRMLLFMVGFFHDWALGYIRKKAVEVFQANQNAATELPVAMIEGVDDLAADLLDELGISSVQHLATQNPLELSMRSLYPIKRVIDWIDQALLTLYFREKIVAARELGIRGMSDFITVYRQASGLAAGRTQQSAEVMTALAQKLGMSEAALYLMADGCQHDDNVKFVSALRYFEQTKEAAPAPPEEAGGADIVAASTATPAAPEAMTGDNKITLKKAEEPQAPPPHEPGDAADQLDA